MNTPLLIGLTGGIATGKSTFARMLVSRLGAGFFCADVCVRELFHDPEIARQIGQNIDPKALGNDGRPDRAYLRNLVFEDEAARRALEGILHPRVRSAWTAKADEAAARGLPFVADIPLLFETGADQRFETLVTVACSPVIQRQRLLGRRGINPSLAKKMIASQWPIDSKIEKSTHVVWNDGDLEALRLQSDFLFCLFDVRSG